MSDDTPTPFDLGGLLDSEAVRVVFEGRATEFIHQLFDTAEEALDEGGPLAATLLRSLLPSLMKQSTATTENVSDAAEILARTRDLFAEQSVALHEYAGIAPDTDDGDDDWDDDDD
jgi:hypothetical protein